MEPAVNFVDISATPERLFALLPPDWRSDIEPVWPDYATGSRIFALQRGAELIGGGIVFHKPAPDTLAYRELARSLFERGFLYIGFLWIRPAERDRGYGGLWLTQLRCHLPEQSFWLAIEDARLRAFYERNGFLVEQVVNWNGHREWILIRDRDPSAAASRTGGTTRTGEHDDEH